MSFDAGAIVGTVLLDTSPVSRAIGSVMGSMGMLEKSGTSSFKTITPPASVSAGFGGVGSAIKGAAGMLGGWVVAAGAAVGVTLSLGAAVSQVAQAMDDIEAMGKQAAAAGLSAEAYSRLAHAAHMADISQEGLSTALSMMGNNLADAANNAGPAKDTMDQLGLSIDEIIAMPADQALGQIADALNNVQNASEKLNLARNIFGKQAGPEFLTLLAGGSAGIAALAAESDKFGKTLSAVDVAHINQANDAFKNVGDVIRGVVLRAAVELAPYVEGLAKKFIDVGTAGGGVAQHVVPSLGGVAITTAKCTDLLEYFRAQWGYFKATVVWATAQSMLALDSLGKKITGILDLIPFVEASVSQEFSGTASALNDIAGEMYNAAADAYNAWSDGKNSANAIKWLDDIKRQSTEAAQATAAAGTQTENAFRGTGKASADVQKAADALAQLRQEVEQFGMTDLQKKMAEFAAMPGATQQQIEEYQQMLDSLRRKQGFTALDDLQKQVQQFNLSPLEKKLDDMRRSGLLDQDQLDQFGQLIAQLDQLEASKAIEDKVKAFRESIKSPLEQLNEATVQLDQWLQDGRISQEERDKGVAEARKRLLGESGQVAGALPTFQAANSAQAMAARLDRINGTNRQDVANKQLEEQKTMVAVLREIRRALNIEQDPVVEVVGA